MYGFYEATSTIPTVGQSEVSVQWQPTTNTTLADHSCRQQKWPPSAPHEALGSTQVHRMDGQHPLEHANIILGGYEGVYGPQNTPMVWQCALLEQRNALRAIHTFNNPQAYTCLLRGLSPIHSMSRCGMQGLMWGARGPYLLRRPWLWWL
jgi:hypothetical protein